MRFMFVHWVVEDRGSAQDIYHYTRAAQELGHEVAIYGAPSGTSAFNYSRDIDAADTVVLLFEWTTELQHGDRVDWVRLLSKVPRRRRLVVDLDGKYNDAISVIGDYNHQTEGEARAWVDICDGLVDKIFQATLHPLRANVRTFLFHAYSPGWEVPLDFSAKEFGMYCVGNNWFRWRAMRRVLEAIEPVREHVGRIGLVGSGWDAPAPWVHPMLGVDAYYTDPDYLARLGVEVMPAIHFSRVIEGMGKGVFMPVIYRPLFDHLGLVTCRTFEAPGANTIPLFTQDARFIEEVYGEDALELALFEGRPEERIIDVLRRPDWYARIVEKIRRRLAERHSYAMRVEQLVELARS
jgi:hypothetical protein